MLQQLLKLVTEYGYETVAIALLINIFTGLIKLPIKALAKKMEDSTRVTRFIVFLPVILGFVFTYCYAQFLQGVFILDVTFITLWLTSSSLSLTIYAFLEKLFPSREKILSDYEVKENKKLLQEIAKLAQGENNIDNANMNSIDETSEDVQEETEYKEVIILKGNIDENIKVEK